MDCNIKSAVNEDKIDLTLDVIRALTNNLRLEIISFLHKNPQSNVGTIYKSLKLEQSNTSQHLRILRNAKIAVTKRAGKQILYSLNYDYIFHFIGIINHFPEYKKRN